MAEGGHWETWIQRIRSAELCAILQAWLSSVWTTASKTSICLTQNRLYTHTSLRAPENPFPIGLEDVWQGVLWVSLLYYYHDRLLMKNRFSITLNPWEVSVIRSSWVASVPVET